MKLEERSRDLAEENLKKEITNAVNMLEVSIGQGWWGGWGKYVSQNSSLRGAWDT